MAVFLTGLSWLAPFFEVFKPLMRHAETIPVADGKMQWLQVRLACLHSSLTDSL
jgi:hypothetical protein